MSGGIDLGVYYAINYNEEDVLQKIKEITSGKLVEYLILSSDVCDEIGKMIRSLQDSRRL